MKKISSVFLVFGLSTFRVLACELCKSHQPKMLREVAHGTGPQGTMDYVLLWGAILIVLITLVLSIRLLLLPNKLDKNHPIKFLPLNENQ